MESGVDLCRVQELLGHSNLETTRIYLHVMDKDLKSPADQLSGDNVEGRDGEGSAT